MIRAENAIDQLLSRFALAVGDSVPNDQIYGHLTTVNDRTGPVTRLKVDGSTISKSIDQWVRDKKYSTSDSFLVMLLYMPC